jgi:SAM-dependent methyltransferase
MTDLAAMLSQLYERQSRVLPGERYLPRHAEPAFLRGSVRVFEFYSPYLPEEGRILDWGCRHAPDACLMRARFGTRLELDGCDVFDAEEYSVFLNYSGLRYARLRDAVKLPYEDAAFDAVVASGVLEHVPMDYESLKELNRVLKPKGRLVVTYLPNRASVEEWRLRRRDPEHAHVRLYSRGELQAMLMHSGFRPLAIGYQTQFDKLAPAEAMGRVLKPLVRFVRAHRLTSCLCAVAEKTEYF